MGRIYAYKHKIDGIVLYVGKTITLKNERHYAHQQNPISSFDVAAKKIGWGNIILEILFIDEEDSYDLCKLEACFIEILNPKYNISRPRPLMCWKEVQLLHDLCMWPEVHEKTAALD